MALKGLLIDTNWCTGCHSCEMACQQEHDFCAEVSGIFVNEVGPFKIAEDKWQFDGIPYITEYCDQCKDRVATGRQPSCVQHCQANCMTYGDFADLAAKVDSAKFLLFSLEEK